MATILLVEDEAAVRWVLAEALSRRGHACWEAKDGVEAVDLLRAGTPDLVLSDISMPRMDGLALARHLAAPGRRWVPLLFLTSHGDEETARLAAEAGALGCLPKPCREADLAAAVAAALAAPPPGDRTPEPAPEGTEEAPEAVAEPAPVPAEGAPPSPEGTSPAESGDPGVPPRRRGWLAALRTALPGGRRP